jgi:hypothetical protein
MFYYLYKTTNLVNDKIYIGVHQTNDIDDGYMGSGKVIQHAIKKYGIDNFSKEILQIFNSKDEMFEREREIVNEIFLEQGNVYNLALGGSGGSILLNRKPFCQNHTQDTKDKISSSRKNKQISKEGLKKLKENHWSKTRPEDFLAHVTYAGSRRWINYDKTLPRKTSTEVKEKLSNSLLKYNEELKQNGKEHPVKGMIREKVLCPYCGKIGAKNTLSRWHFENCKFKE